MKKIFKLEESNKKRERTLEAVKNEIRKYLKRERKKKLSDNSTMFWDFDCRFGKTKDDSNSIEIKDLIKVIDITLTESWEECYIEILAKEVAKPIKEVVENTEEVVNS